MAISRFLETAIRTGLKRLAKSAKRAADDPGRAGREGAMPGALAGVRGTDRLRGAALIRAAADVSVGAARDLRAWSPRAGDWAIGRSLSPNALTGVSLLFGLCAAVWLSGGTPADTIRGSLAALGWLLARAVAARLAGFTAARRASGPARSLVRAVRNLDGSTDWLVLPRMGWSRRDLPGSVPPDVTLSGTTGLGAAGTKGAGTAARQQWAGPASLRGRLGFTWLAAVCAIAAEFAIYGGMAAYGQAGRWTGMWPFAVLTVAVVATAELVTRCAAAGLAARHGRARGAIRAVIATASARAPRIGPGARVTVALLVLVIHGPRVAFFAIVVMEALVVAVTIITRVRRGGSAATGTEPSAGPDQHAVIMACRDDGPVARWAGRAVQGRLPPLPPLIAGVSASILLASLGMRNLPGIVVVAPLVVMMLAAPGSAHPHDGRLDWLVPALLLTGQYVYLAALGFAQPVSGPVVFALCAVTGIWYVHLAAGVPDAPAVLGPAARTVRHGRPEALATGIGWEGRMFLAGLTAIFGIAAFGYLGLAAYLVLLVGQRTVAGRRLQGEDDASDRPGSGGRRGAAAPAGYR